MNFDFIGDIFFPPTCIACADSIARGVICVRCQENILTFDTLFCGTCAARLPEQKKICHKDAPYLLGAAGPYHDDTLHALIHALKFRGIADAAQPLAELLAAYTDRLALDLQKYIVMPMPLSPARERARGFNQSALIARRFAEICQLPLEENLLVRRIHRKPQSKTQDIFERRENIRGCFALNINQTQNATNEADTDRTPRADAAISDAHIILIDDVTTSGTTFTEAARTLKSAGAKKIIALAVAKA